MTTRSRGPLAGFKWLQRSVSLVFRHPKPILGGATVLLLACLAPSLVLFASGYLMPRPGTPPDPTAFGWIMLGSTLIGLLIVPLYAGYLQLIDAAENEHAARIRDIFRPYREGDAMRLICYGLALVLTYAVIYGAIILVANSHLVDWYMQALAAQTHHQPPPPLPDGAGTAIALFAAFGIFMMGFYAISFGQVALHRRGVTRAIGDGCVGALKNLLPILILVISCVVIWIIATIIIAIAMLLVSLLALLVGTWLTTALLILVNLVITLFALAVMFGVMYFMWRDVCDDDIAADTTDAIPA